MVSKARWSDVLMELEGIVPEAMLHNYIMRMVFKRVSDQEYDKQQAARFKGLKPDEIKEILIKDIMDGQDIR